MINRARKNGLSLKDKSWLRNSVETKLQLETLENRELLAADMLAGLADLAEGEAGDKVQMRLVATDNSGNPITNINLNDTFQLRALTTDLRTDGDGVFATFLDINYPSQFASVTGSATHYSPYTNFKSGTTTTAGLMDEIGSMAGLSTLGTSELLVFSVPMQATAEGTILFTSNPADVLPAHDVLVYGENNAVSSDIITYGSYSLEVTAQGTLPFEEDFNDGVADDFSVASGTFEVINSRYDAAPDSTRSNAFSLVDLTVPLPNKVRMETTVNLKNISGYQRTGLIVFDYVDASNYKYVGANASGGNWFMNELKNGSLRGLESKSESIQADTNYEFEMRMEGNVVSFYVDEQLKMTHDFGTEDLRDGKLGVGTQRGISSFDNIRIAEIFPSPEATDDAVATLVNTPITIAVLANDTHETQGTAIEIKSATDGAHGMIELVDSDQNGKNDSITYTPGTDYRGVDAFEYIVTDAADQTDRGSVAVTVASGLPVYDDFNDNIAEDFSYAAGTWAAAEGRFTSQSTNGTFLATLNLGVDLPNKYLMRATLQSPSLNNRSTNGGFVFDYVSDREFKYARYVGRAWQIGKYSNGRYTTLDSTSTSIQKNTDYAAELRVEGSHVRFIVDDIEVGNVTFTGEDLTDGELGLFAKNSLMAVDNFEVKEILPSPEATDDAVATLVNTPITIAVLANDTHETQGTAIEIKSATDGAHGMIELVDSDQNGKNDSITYTPGTDYRGVDAFEYIVTDAADQTDRGSVAVTVASGLPLREDFDDGVAEDFNVVSGTWTIVNDRYVSNNRNGRSLATARIGVALPVNTELSSVMRFARNSGYQSNGGLVFDYQDSLNFKYILGSVEGRGWTMGEVVSGSDRTLTTKSATLSQTQDYEVAVVIEGATATLFVDDVETITRTFDGNLNTGSLGLMGVRSKAQFDDIVIREFIPSPDAENDSFQTLVNTAIDLQVLDNDTPVENTTIHVSAVSTTAGGTLEMIDDGTDGLADFVRFTPNQDFRGEVDFSYTVTDNAGQTDVGKVSGVVAADLPVYDDFNDNIAEDFSYAAGTWAAAEGRFTSQSTNGTFLATLNLGVDLPNKYLMRATLQSPSLNNRSTNGGFVFDYVSDREFKYARYVGRAWQIGKYSNGRYTTLDSTSTSIQKNTDYAAELRVEGSHVRFIVDDIEVGNVTFTGEDLTDGELGLFAKNSLMAVDNFEVKEILPSPEATDDAVATLVNTPITIAVLANDTHETQGTAIEIKSATDGAHGMIELVDSDQNGKNDSITYTPGTDYRGVDAFEYIVTDAADQTDRGSVAVTVASGLPLREDFDDGVAEDFNVVSGTWTIVNDRYVSNNRNGRSLATARIGVALPVNTELSSVMRFARNSGYQSNGGLVFDYQDSLNFKYILGSVEGRGWTMGEVVSGSDRTLTTKSATLSQTQDYEVAVVIEGATATLFVDDVETITRTFDGNLNTGSLGLMGVRSKAQFDDIVIREFIPSPDAENDSFQTLVNTAIDLQVLDNDTPVENTTIHVSAVSTTAGGTLEMIDDGTDGLADFVRFTPNQDFRGEVDFSYTVTDNAGQTDVGKVSGVVAADLPVYDDFNDNIAEDFSYAAGTWAAAEGRFTSQSTNGTFLATLNLGVDLPNKYLMRATLQSPSLNNRSTNGGFVFDYVSDREFKYARYVGRAWQIGKYSNGRYTTLDSTSTSIQKNTDYAAELRVEGSHVRFIVDDIEVGNVTFTGEDLTDGELGLFAKNSLMAVDNFEVKEILPSPEATDDAVATLVNTPITIAVLANDTHETQGTAIEIKSATDGAHGMIELVDSDQNGKNDSITYTPGTDYRGVDAFEYIVTDAADQTDRGSVAVTVASGLPLREDFDDGVAEDFNVVSGTWTIVNDRYVSNNRNGRSLATARIGVALPVNTELSSVMRFARNSGYQSNGGLVFDYQDSLNFKYILGSVEGRGWTMGEVVSGSDRTLTTKSATLSQTQDYEVAVVIEGATATLFVDDVETITRTFDGNLNTGSLGLMGVRSKAQFDDIVIREFIPSPDAENDSFQTLVNTAIDLQVLDNDTPVENTTIHVSAVSTTAGGTLEMIDDGTDGLADFVRFTPNQDFRGEVDFSYTVTDNAGQTDVGKVSGVVAADLPVYDDFNDNIAEDFSYAAGTWAAAEGRFTSQSTNGTFLATLNLGVDLPNKYLMRATLQSPSLNNRSTNGGFVFDYVSDREFKYARYVGRAWQIGKYSNGRYTTLDSTSTSIQKNTDYAAELRVEGSHVRFIVDDIEVGNVTFTGEDLTDGELGLFAKNSLMAVDNFEVKEILPSPEATDDAVATLVNTPITIAVLANDTHETQGTAIEIKSATDGAHGMIELVDSDQNGKNDSITYTPGTDYRGVDAFEYIVTDAADQTDRGSVIVVTAGPLPIVDDFSDNLAQDFLFDNSQWQVSGERFTAIAGEENFAGVLIGELLPANVEFNATMNIQSVGGFNRNGYFVFDYTDDSNFKYIGANENGRRWEVVEVSGGITFVQASLRETIRTGQDYQLQLLIEGSKVTLNVDGTEKLEYQFDESLNLGGLALYTNKSKTQFDNVEVKEYVVLPVANDDRVSTKIDTQVTIGILANDYAPNGILEVTAFTEPDNATAVLIDTNDDGDLDSMLFTPTTGFEGVTTFTYDVRDPKGFTDMATVTVSVADALSYTEDFNDGVADGFATAGGIWEVINSRYSLSSQDMDGISVLTLAEEVPEDFEIGVTINTNDVSGFHQNAFLVFDYISAANFKFAGVLVGSGRWTIGEYNNGSRRYLSQANAQVDADTDLAISLLYQGNKATLKSGGDSVLEWAFSEAGNDGKFGLLAINAQVDFDDFYAKAVDAAMGE